MKSRSLAAKPAVDAKWSIEPPATASAEEEEAPPAAARAMASIEATSEPSSAGAAAAPAEEEAARALASIEATSEPPATDHSASTTLAVAWVVCSTASATTAWVAFRRRRRSWVSLTPRSRSSIEPPSRALAAKPAVDAKSVAESTRSGPTPSDSKRPIESPTALAGAALALAGAAAAAPAACRCSSTLAESQSGADEPPAALADVSLPTKPASGAKWPIEPPPPAS